MVHEQGVCEFFKLHPRYVHGHGGVGKLLVVDVQARHGMPEIPPPRGQHAVLHGLPRREEGHDGVEDFVAEGAQPVPAPLAGPDDEPLLRCASPVFRSARYY